MYHEQTKTVICFCCSMKSLYSIELIVYKSSADACLPLSKAEQTKVLSTSKMGVSNISLGHHIQDLQNSLEPCINFCLNSTKINKIISVCFFF